MLVLFLFCFVFQSLPHPFSSVFLLFLSQNWLHPATISAAGWLILVIPPTPDSTSLLMIHQHLLYLPIFSQMSDYFHSNKKSQNHFFVFCLHCPGDFSLSFPSIWLLSIHLSSNICSVTKFCHLFIHGFINYPVLLFNSDNKTTGKCFTCFPT